MMKNVILYNLLIAVFFLSGCSDQINDKSIDRKTEIVGGGCDGCELMYVGMPENISSESVSGGWTEGKQQLIITGKIYQTDGKTPARGVIVYYWHTDESGLYSSKSTTPAEVKRHGHLRGWVKSDSEGNYTIKTSKAAHYPNEDMAAHIHLSIKEPEIKNEYYADLYFDDDPKYLQHKKKYGKIDRAGTELLRVLLENGKLVAEHNIILGMNIPNYPQPEVTGMQSGLKIGEDQPSFMPYHAFGPDKGTQTCPVCKYGRYHGILYFVGNDPDWTSVKSWLKFLETESEKRLKYLKVYLVYGDENNHDKEERQKQLEVLGKELHLKNIALTYVPSFLDQKTEVHLNKINPGAENTFIIYKHRVIVDKLQNLQPTGQNFELIARILDKTQGAFFRLPEPKHE